MAVDRMIRAEMRVSLKVNAWPIPLRYFWTQLWGYCDDYGRGIYDARLIVADTFPLDEEITSETVARWMVALEGEGVIRPYEVGGRRFFEVVNWDEHQDLRYRKKSKIPEPSAIVREISEDSATFGARTLQGEGEVEGEIEGEGARRAQPSRYCSDHPKGTTDKCARCKDARLDYEAWQAEQASKPTPQPIGLVDRSVCAHWAAKRQHQDYCGRCDSRLIDGRWAA